MGRFEIIKYMANRIDGNHRGMSVSVIATCDTKEEAEEKIKGYKQNGWVRYRIVEKK